MVLRSFVCPPSTASTFLWQNNLQKKAIAVGEGMVVSPEAIICISSVTVFRFVLSVIYGENSWHFIGNLYFWQQLKNYN
jgi:hypothetical protein